MNELDIMTRQVIRFTLIFSGIVSILAFIFTCFDVYFLIGIWIGCFLSLAGYGMIVRMAKSLKTDEHGGKRQGLGNYAIRYIMYAVVLAFFTYHGFSVFAMLAGMLCQKAALITYSILERKN